MRLRIFLVGILSIIMVTCTRNEPIPNSTMSKESFQVPTTPPPALPSATLLVASIIDLPTSTASPTQTQEVISTLTPTLSAWEMIQAEVARYRNLLDRESDGYNGLTLALEQDGLNQDWCAGLSAAIGDFNYIGDTESVQALKDLQTSQGCS